MSELQVVRRAAPAMSNTSVLLTKEPTLDKALHGKKGHQPDISKAKVRPELSIHAGVTDLGPTCGDQ